MGVIVVFGKVSSMPASADAQHLSESLGQPLDRCVVALRRCHEDVEAAAAYLMEFMVMGKIIWEDMLSTASL